ncbi:MAG: hypothetical protein WCK06_10565 [Actinomycetota bacterium]
METRVPYDNVPTATAASLSENQTFVVGVILVLAVGFILTLTLLISLTRKWKTSFTNREWTLVPSLEAAKMTDAIDSNRRALSSLNSSTQQAQAMSQHALDAITETRKEFGILGVALDAKDKQIAALEMGQEFRHRKAMILAAVRALDIIEVDAAAGESSEQTLRALAIDLRESLEDNHVEIYTPEIGTRIHDARGVNASSARHERTNNQALVGTIAAVERPAFIAVGAGGREEVLRPARVSIYVLAGEGLTTTTTREQL